MKEVYKIEDRISFMAKLKGERKHFIGYIKQIKHSILGTRYVVCIAKTEEIVVIKPSSIFGLVEKKERNNNR